MNESRDERLLRRNRPLIVNCVTEVDGLVDFLIKKNRISEEMISEMDTDMPSTKKIRKLLDYVRKTKASEVAMKWIRKNVPNLDLENSDSDQEAPPRKRPKTEADYYSPETFGRVRGRGYRGTASRGGTRGRGYRGTGSRGGMRGRGYRGAATRGGTRGRGYRGAGARGGTTGRGAAFKPEDSEEARIIERDDEVRAEREKLLEKLTLEELRELFRPQLERQPNLVFDVLKLCQHTNDAPPSEPNPHLPWCKCGNCRDMPTDIEKLCCDQQPDYCISRLHHFCYFCLDDELLRQDTEVQVAQTADDLKAYRNAAYGRFVTWKYGPLGPGIRVPVPSCCVWRIRDKYPDPHGQYTGFIGSPQKDSPEKTCSLYSKKLSFG
ncbi:uncharacterized protein LOC118815846 isoform X2 [Colossoma macropomum]|uniref:uncharacterized protein LOC118815846 isoform X2 n=1 Tax=Colossoma macropomum TaxID=42526 RepID=UPI001863B7B8|nr:uncharacterized protein LOC118815846 isoform X2 [Colossoma macropomum]